MEYLLLCQKREKLKTPIEGRVDCSFLWELRTVMGVGIIMCKNPPNKNRVTTAQGKRGIWFLLFPDRENTGNIAVTQGKFLRHRENIFDCIYHCQKHVFLHIFSVFFSLASLDILSSLRSLFLILFLLVYQCIYCLTFFPYHIGYKVSTKLILGSFKNKFKKCNLEYVHLRIF